MVKLRLKVGPKGQIIIPKILREAYGIKEGEYVVIEPLNDMIVIRRIEDPGNVIKWVKERRKRVKGKPGRLGDLAELDLEEEFDEGLH